MSISLDNVMALAIDFQEKLVSAMHEKENLIKRTEILLNGLSELNVDIVTSQQYTKGLGMTIPELTAIIGDKYFDKRAFSCYKDADILQRIKEIGKKYIIICGIEAHICVLQTCLDLAEAGFVPVLVTDCTSSRKQSDMNNALLRMAKTDTLFTTSESILFELMGSASHPSFRTISNLIK